MRKRADREHVREKVRQRSLTWNFTKGRTGKVQKVRKEQWDYQHHNQEC